MDVCEPNDIHPQTTQRSGHTYCFTPKHHGAGSKSDSRWLPSLSRDEEFGIFDLADLHDLSDPNGNLYGLRIRQEEAENRALELGTRDERIARFWAEQEQRHWHGHPLWPIDTRGSDNRKSQKLRPPAIVFDKMVTAGLITESRSRRLKAGKH